MPLQFSIRIGSFREKNFILLGFQIALKLKQERILEIFKQTGEKKMTKQ